MMFFHELAVYSIFLAAVFSATLAMYFALGFGISWLNQRNPERRIQKSRFGERRRAKEIRQSIWSIGANALVVSGGLWSQYVGLAPTPWPLSWIWALPQFVLCMILFDGWFYFTHRLLHTKALFRFHALHHRSLAPTPWSNDSIGVVETLLAQGFYLIIVFVVPFNPLLLIAHRIFDQINGTFGHAGFEYWESPTARRPWPMLCASFHDQHHEEFRYNFANFFSIWDRVFGTVAPDYDERVQNMETSLPTVTLKAPN